MSDFQYLPRLMDAQLKETLDYIGAVLIVGPKWCGKTKSKISLHGTPRSAQPRRFARVTKKNSPTLPLPLQH
ncbi:hypothetical protein [uncultured Flavonifractor sp.]|uniref:hypothetical protein n=1 Tax=uncultured Flavonifractor sp. TaxID=1193534 RepID=UPI002612F1B6|nr:hypothetical protein [uncultured Flavonifractor sp.]